MHRYLLPSAKTFLSRRVPAFSRVSGRVETSAGPCLHEQKTSFKQEFANSWQQRSWLTMAATEAASIHSNEQVLLWCDWATKPRWKQLMKEAGLPVAYEEEVTCWDKVQLMVGWRVPPAVFQKCPNLKVVMSMGAGVEHLLQPGQVPDNVEIARIVDPLMSQRMATWVLWGVINFQRRFDQYWAAQKDCRWDRTIEPNAKTWDNGEVNVGVLGFGGIGRAAAELLAGAGYKVSVWTRTRKEHPSIDCYAGQAELQHFVSQSNILVCLLPLTADTEGIINSTLLSWLPKNAAVINVARGKHVVDSDLIAALDSGHLGHALLDVFIQEPLAPDHPFWKHPKIRITPHVSAFTDVPNAVMQIKENYERLLNGRALLNLVDKHAGY